MLISDMKEGLNRIECIYPFKDEKTDLRLERNCRSCCENIVMIQTHDDECGVDITLSTTVKQKIEN